MCARARLVWRLQADTEIVVAVEKRRSHRRQRLQTIVEKPERVDGKPQAAQADARNNFGAYFDEVVSDFPTSTIVEKPRMRWEIRDNFAENDRRKDWRNRARTKRARFSAEREKVRLGKGANV
eukprot:6213202-Pleurochrysis_carterae.AAC.6